MESGGSKDYGEGCPDFLVEFSVDESVFRTVKDTETLYKYFSMAIVLKLLEFDPASIGAEVTLSSDGVEANSQWCKALSIKLKSSNLRTDLLGIKSEDTLVLGEVKNVEYVRDPTDLKLWRVADYAQALDGMLEKDPGYVSALVAVFNGAGSEGGG